MTLGEWHSKTLLVYSSTLGVSESSDIAIGVKTMLNEFVAYERLSVLIANGVSSNTKLIDLIEFHAL